jgi:5'(3')-deoxyribonucleotidase
MKRIAIDMDEVITNAGQRLLDFYNRDFNEEITIRDVHGTTLHTIRPHAKNHIIRYLSEPTFFRDLDVIEDSQEVIRELSEQYEIYIATAAMEFPTSFTEKYEWLREHFPFLSDKNFVFCGDKSIIHADYLIDDRSDNFKGFKGQGILFSAPHNLHEEGYLRVNSWKEVREYFLT